ncbi:hypothetical protein [Sphingobium chungbukense]|uniref:Uncharacterized protein n=1 Tax=Sphingobium chungbukense TaxID=56193 RepID=A0A0M3AV91_9SPHN|nr:hypothetical protein [Sphingobium chungbukense]KKW92494.1 hypothetical protein YP76_05920 [Sphingobium chungbukense]
MVDRTAASIVIGGNVSAADYALLIEMIASYDLRTEWEGEPFDPAQRAIGEALSLYDQYAAWGRFDRLESWCIDKGLPFVRWCGGYCSQWGSQRLVFTGEGEPCAYGADDEDELLIGREKVRELGSYEAIQAYFVAGDFPVPPLRVEGEISGAAP